MADHAITFPEPSSHAHYDEDFFAWTQEQAARLRAGEFSALDVEHLAEEIESVGGRDSREVRSRLEVVILHLLKWRYQPEYQCRSWRSSIWTQRGELERVLAASPSLRRHLPEWLPDAYERGRYRALAETGLERMPETCPFSLDQVMDPEWLPL